MAFGEFYLIRFGYGEIMLENYDKIFIKSIKTGNPVLTETGRGVDRELENTKIMDYSGVSVIRNFENPYLVLTNPTSGELPAALTVRPNTDSRLIDVKDFSLLQTLVWTTASNAQSASLCIVPFLPTTDAKTSWKPAGIIQYSDTFFIVQWGMDFWDGDSMAKGYPDAANPTTLYYLSMIQKHNFICDVSAFEKIGIFTDSTSGFSGVDKMVIGYNLI